MSGKVTPFGYAGGAKGESWKRLDALMADPNTVIVDARKSPWCRWDPRWNRPSLGHHWDARYRFLGDLLGNKNYRPEDRHKGIELINPGQGLHELSMILRSKSVILLCACKEYETCHRRVIVEQLREVLPDIEVIV